MLRHATRTNLMRVLDREFTTVSHKKLTNYNRR